MNCLKKADYGKKFTFTKIYTYNVTLLLKYKIHILKYFKTLCICVIKFRIPPRNQIQYQFPTCILSLEAKYGLYLPKVNKN